MKVDIITGFLGAGKTTFITKYANYLKSKGEKLIIIENEFGLAGVDGSLLKNNEFEVKEISGGCICCTQKIYLALHISEAAKAGYDRVIIEPSGIYNLDTVFDLMQDPSVKDCATLNGIITIIKPDFMQFTSGVYESIFLSQFYSPGAIVVSNTQSYTEEEIDNTLLDISNFVNNKNENYSLSDIDICTKPWDEFTDEDFEKFSNIGISHHVHKVTYQYHERIVQTCSFSTKLCKKEDIDELINFILNLKDCKIIRIKGYVKVGEKDIYSINCTHNCFEIKPNVSKHAVVNVLGLDVNKYQNLIKEKIASMAFNK